MKVDVFAEVRGEKAPAGVIETLPGSGEQFTYGDSWLERKGARPLSLSLPLSERSYSAREMRPYFDGLLPEGGARSAIARQIHVLARSYVKILAHLGDECIGAVLFRPRGAEGDSLAREEAYVRLDEGALDGLSQRSFQPTAKLSSSDRFSLSGSQAKMSLYRAEDGAWYEAKGGAPSTHILKPASACFGDSCLNEAICTLAAQSCGVKVSDIEIVEAEIPLVCTRRFDRSFDASCREVGSLTAPHRLHQEDFCQALGVVPEHKYEEGRRSYADRIGQALRENSTEPIDDLISFWKYMVFNFLIGNCDAHLKNYALLRSADWSELRLAPLYDVLCTSVYEELSTDMGMSIGGVRDMGKVTRESFAQAAEGLLMPKALALGVVDSIADQLQDGVLEAGRRLGESGVCEAEGLAERIAQDADKRLRAIC